MQFAFFGAEPHEAAHEKKGGAESPKWTGLSVPLFKQGQALGLAAAGPPSELPQTRQLELPLRRRPVEQRRTRAALPERLVDLAILRIN